MGVERGIDESVEAIRQAGRHVDHSLDGVQGRLVQQLAEGQQAPDGFQLNELDGVRVDLGLEEGAVDISATA
ncbi:hypothetical protein GCM10025734_82190 [Kitasatospora paranensis]